MKRNATKVKINNVSFIIVFTLFVLCSTYLYSRPTGISGYTLKTNSTGCASCHGGASSQVSVVINGPSTLKTGETGNYTVTITGGSGSGVGTDIAASNGTLTNSDANLKVLNGELTQPSAKAFSGGKYVFNFKYTAPSTAGTQILYANGVSTKPEWNFAPNFSVNVQAPTSDVREDGQTVASYALNQNYPNPFNPATQISYSLSKQSSVKLVVYNSIGQEVKTLFNGIQAAGSHSVNFDAAGLTSGIYFYSIEAKSETDNEIFKSVRKMAFLK